MTNLRKLKNEKNLTTQELAEMAGVTQQMINHMELGKRKGSVKTNLKLAKILNVTLEELIGEDE